MTGVWQESGVSVWELREVSASASHRLIVQQQHLHSGHPSHHALHVEADGLDRVHGSRSEVGLVGV